MEIEYYFKILNLSMTDNLELVNAQFKKLMKLYHPDVCKDIDAEDKAKKISEAYTEIKKYITMNKTTQVNNQKTAPKYENYNYQNFDEDEFLISDEIKRCLKILSLKLRLAWIKYRKFCIYAKEEYDCFIEFKDFIKLLVKEKMYIDYIGIDEKTLKSDYNYYCKDQDSKNKLEFIDWLEIRVREKRAMIKLNTNFNDSYNNYKYYLKSLSNGISPLSYVDWLENCVKEQELIMLYVKNSGMDYETIHNLYDIYCNVALSNGYLACSFLEWMQKKMYVDAYTYAPTYAKQYKKV